MFDLEMCIVYRVKLGSRGAFKRKGIDILAVEFHRSAPVARASSTLAAFGDLDPIDRTPSTARGGKRNGYRLRDRFRAAAHRRRDRVRAAAAHR